MNDVSYISKMGSDTAAGNPHVTERSAPLNEARCWSVGGLESAPTLRCGSETRRDGERKVKAASLTDVVEAEKNNKNYLVCFENSSPRLLRTHRFLTQQGNRNI